MCITFCLEYTECDYGECGEGKKFKITLVQDTRPGCPAYNKKLKVADAVVCPAKKLCPSELKCVYRSNFK